MSDTLNRNLDRIRLGSLGVGVVGLLASTPVWSLDPTSFLRSYLLGYIFWVGISLGSLSILLLHHMVGGNWGFVIRRILEAASRTLPLMALLFVPVLLGLPDLYEWAQPEALAQDEILQHKAPYLNVPFFVIRALLYFAAWIVFATAVNRLSLQQDQQGGSGLARKLQKLSGPGLALYAVTATFASVDWVMSLEPHWYSTIYGLLYVAGFGLIAFAFSIIVLQGLSKYEPLASVLSGRHFHDLGNLTLAFVMLWAYLSFSQYLIVWSGNLPEEVPWYVHRLHGGWQYLGLFLIVAHFAFPFLLLLSRSIKRKGAVMAWFAAALLFLRFADLYFLIIPAFGDGSGLNIQWTDIVTPIGIGGFWITIFVAKLKERPLLPLKDPRMDEVLHRGEVLEHG